jgi:hypothetical protein
MKLNPKGFLSFLFTMVQKKEMLFTLEYATRKVQRNWLGLNMTGTHQVLVFADDFNLLHKNINTKKIIEKLCYTLMRRLRISGFLDFVCRPVF